MNFKVRTYKKSGADKGNTNYEKIFPEAETAMKEYNKLFKKEDYSLNPTLWAETDEDWIRYSEADFEEFFLDGKRLIDITKENVNCCDELIVDTEKGTVEAFYELWCDVNKYFGTDTRDNDSTWINFYTYWHTDGSVTAKYFIDSDDGEEEYNWSLTEPEHKFFLNKMEKHSKSVYHLSMEQLFKTEKEYEEIEESAKNGLPEDYFQRVVDNYISSMNPEEWNGFGDVPDSFNPQYRCMYLAAEPQTHYFIKPEKDNVWKYHISKTKNVPNSNCITLDELNVPFSEGREGLLKNLLFLAGKTSSLEPEDHITVGGKDYLCAPLSEVTIRKHMDKDNYISGVIKIHISDMIDNDFEDFLDFISTELVGNELLMNIDYKVLGLCEDEENTLYLLVSGDVSNVLGEDRLVFDLSKVKKDGVIQDVSGVKRQFVGRPYHITEITDAMIKGTIGTDGYIYSMFPSFLEYEEDEA